MNVLLLQYYFPFLLLIIKYEYDWYNRVFQAETLMGIEDPILAGKELLRRSIRTKWVIIKMGSIGSILITRSSISCAPAFKVRN